MSDCRKCAEFDWCIENEDCGLFKPKPFTNADRIRSMTDEELAILFTTLISEIENGIMEKLEQAGVDADLIEFPVASLQSQLEYLQEEVQNG